METKGNNLEAIPAELTVALKADGLESFFIDCTPAHRREYLQWIGSAKKPKTRLARSRQAVKMLATKRTEAARKHKK